MVAKVVKHLVWTRSDLSVVTVMVTLQGGGEEPGAPSAARGVGGALGEGAWAGLSCAAGF